MALSVGTIRTVTARVYPEVRLLTSAATGYAASRSVEFGLSSPVPQNGTEAILRPSKTKESLTAKWNLYKKGVHPVLILILIFILILLAQAIRSGFED